MHSDRVGRIVRGLLQVGLVQVGLQTYQAFAATPMNDIQYGTLTTLLTTVLTIAQLVLEDSNAIPTFMRSHKGTGDGGPVKTFSKAPK